MPGMGGPNAPRPGGKAPGRAAEPQKKRTADQCAGHGPMDAPHHVNWWKGMLMVNNARAEKGGFVNSLLFRYHNEVDACDPKNEPPPFLASLMNFGLLAFILYRFGKKPIGEALQKRRQTIMGDIENATRLREEAEARLNDYEDRFERIEETLGQLKAEYAAQSEVEKKHILAEAEERRARMRRDAEFRIEQELKSAKVELLQEAVLGAVKAAEEIIRQRATTQDQERLAQEYLKSVPEALTRGSQAAIPAGVASGAAAGAAAGQGGAL
jgi:F-type H+-transporting ATPase subunit b